MPRVFPNVKNVRGLPTPECLLFSLFFSNPKVRIFFLFLSLMKENTYKTDKSNKTSNICIRVKSQNNPTSLFNNNYKLLYYAVTDHIRNGIGIKRSSQRPKVRYMYSGYRSRLCKRRPHQCCGSGCFWASWIRILIH